MNSDILYTLCLLEEIDDMTMSSIILILGDEFDPNITVEKLQKIVRTVELTFGNIGIYSAGKRELMADMESEISGFSALVRNEILDSVELSDEKRDAMSFIVVMTELLNRTKNNDLSWAWEDIKL